MLHLRDLRVQTQQRRIRLHKTGWEYFDDQLLYLFQFFEKQAYIRTLFAKIESNTDVDFAKWMEGLNHFSQTGIQFPRTEAAKAKVCLGILRHCVADDNDAHALSWAYYFSAQNRHDDKLVDFTAAVIDPFFNFLDDQIDELGNVLYLIERFKLKSEWFMQEQLYTLYTENTGAGEKLLDHQLRAFLFEGGIDYPFSEPVSRSGKADIVALLDSDDPLVLEVKIFDPKTGKNVRNIQQGFYQIQNYASDYNENVGYLVIFNCHDGPLVVQTDESTEPEYPTRIFYANKSFFIIVIDINPQSAPASKGNPANQHIITSSQLISK